MRTEYRTGSYIFRWRRGTGYASARADVRFFVVFVEVCVSYLFENEIFGCHVLRTRNDVAVVTFLEREISLNELFSHRVPRCQHIAIV